MWKFAEYISNKNRETVKQLGLVKTILERGGMRVKEHLEEKHDPYVFVFNPDRNLSFEGIRIYKIGDKMAFRVQKQETTHPYGRAYGLNIEEIFEALMGEEDMEEKRMAHQIGRTLINELQDFFLQSARAEKEQALKKQDPLDRVMMRTSGADYSHGLSNNSRDGNIY